MSEENIQVVKAIWDAIGRGETDEAAEMVPEDFVFDFSSSENPDRGFFSGRGEVKAIIERVREPWSKVEYFADEYIDLGDQIIRVGGMRATGKGSGAEVTAHGAQVWTFRDGTPVSAALYQSKQEALEAVGRSG